MRSRRMAARPVREFGFSPNLLSQALRRIFRLLRRGPEQESTVAARSGLEFETLEPRLLLSADLPVAAIVAPAALNGAHDAPVTASTVAAAQPPAIDVKGAPPPTLKVAAAPSPAITAVANALETTTSPFAPQVIYLDLDGAQDATYHGPVKLDAIDIPAFSAPTPLQGQEQAIVSMITQTGPGVIT